eukprot:snap_masked-scaffold_12-processed-gene-2.23-mRNA-1 protein AED:1.00 eAED:1.00 QI:0/0/0/0/1/1/3/0/69
MSSCDPFLISIKNNIGLKNYYIKITEPYQMDLIIYIFYAIMSCKSTYLAVLTRQIMDMFFKKKGLEILV